MSTDVVQSAASSLLEGVKSLPSLVVSKTVTAVSAIYNGVMKGASFLGKSAISSMKIAYSYPVAFCSSNPKVAKAGLASISVLGATYGTCKLSQCSFPWK